MFLWGQPCPRTKGTEPPAAFPIFGVLLFTSAPFNAGRSLSAMQHMRGGACFLESATHPIPVGSARALVNFRRFLLFLRITFDAERPILTYRHMGRMLIFMRLATPASQGADRAPATQVANNPLAYNPSDHYRNRSTMFAAF